MARIAGIDVPNEKRIEASIVYIKGIGPTLAKKILTTAGVSFDKRTKDLTETELAGIQKAIGDMQIVVEGELRRVLNANIRRLQENGSYRGSRHKKGLPVRGQRTRSNSRTRKGKRRTVAGKKKAPSKK